MTEIQSKQLTIQRYKTLKPLQQQPTNQILQGDALQTLKTLESNSVDCIITSPPYWALRDYKVEEQIGNEKTIQEYVNNLTAVFTEAKRVLKKEGTCWIVLGDTYSGNTKAGNKVYGNPEFNKNMPSRVLTLTPAKNTNLQDKSLCLIPERFAISMIDNGWILRNKIIWYKKNCMPSSAKDRFTVDYEYIYFFTKSQKYYFRTQYEPIINPPGKPGNKTVLKNPEVYGINTHAYRTFKQQQKNPDRIWGSETGRIKRCVWQINTKPFPEAHFAVFPEQLVEQCLDAGCPTDGTTLDPFMGSGTTALVALKHNRKFIGIELNPEYIQIANKRIEPYLLQTKLTS